MCKNHSRQFCIKLWSNFRHQQHKTCLKITQVKYTVEKCASKIVARWNHSFRWGNKLDIFQPTTNHLHWLFTQGQGDNLECVSSRVSGPISRSIGRSVTRSCVHAYARRKHAHTGAARRRSHSYARPLELHSFIKVARTDVRASCRTAPCFSPRPAFYEWSVRCLSSLDSVHNAHAHAHAHARGLRAASVKEIVC